MHIFRNKAFLVFIITLGIFIEIVYYSKSQANFNYVNNLLGMAAAPFQKIVFLTGQKMSGIKVYFTDKKEIEQENLKLKKKLALLEKKNRDLVEYKKKSKELKDALNIKDQFEGYKMVGANIIAKDMGNWFYVFTIDRGKNDGIHENLPVITSTGLVGRVFEAGPISSKVVSIIDDNSAVSARISKTRDLVVVKGSLNLKTQGLCILDYIPSDADVTVGDMIETSGLGDIFPKGLIIGKIKQVKKEVGQLNKYGIIETAVDFKRLEEVFVLKK